MLKISVIVSDSGCTTGKPEVETDGRGGATMTLPRGAYYSLTESAHSPFQAEPAHRKESRIARTVVLKLKTSEFKILTRSHTPVTPPSSCEELTNIALSLRERVGMSSQQRFRLVGVGLSNFHDPEDASAQPALFT